MKSVAIGVMVISALVFGLAAHSHADPITVKLSDTITTLICKGGDACDTRKPTSVVAVTSRLGTVTVLVGGTGSGTPELPPLTMDLAYNRTQTSASPAKTYTIAVSEMDVSTGAGQWTALVNGNQGAVSGDAVLTPVPEPATMFLGGLGLIAFGYAARRRLFGR